MDLYIGKKTKKGEDVKIGDILKSGSTAKSVVCKNTKYPNLGEYVCALIDIETKHTFMGPETTYVIKDFIFPIDEILEWNDMQVIGNILTI